MGDSKPSLRWGVEQKLQFIEFRLFWEGHVNRSDLIDKFSVSQNQMTQRQQEIATGQLLPGACFDLRAALRVHMAMCKACPRFERQVLTMRNAMKQWRGYTEDE